MEKYIRAAKYLQEKTGYTVSVTETVTGTFLTVKSHGERMWGIRCQPLTFDVNVSVLEDFLTEKVDRLG